MFSQHYSPIPILSLSPQVVLSWHMPASAYLYHLAWLSHTLMWCFNDKTQWNNEENACGMSPSCGLKGWILSHYNGVFLKTSETWPIMDCWLWKLNMCVTKYVSPQIPSIFLFFCYCKYFPNLPCVLITLVHVTCPFKYAACGTVRYLIMTFVSVMHA